MSPERANTIKFIDWTLGIMRQEWIDSEGDTEAQRKWFERINAALDRRVDVMKLVAYDHAIGLPPAPASIPSPAAKPKVKSKPKQQPPTI